MPPVMREVYSSTVDRVGYDAESGELLVQWRDGKTSAYEGVPQHVADEAQNSWSVGKFLHQTVKPAFRHRYVE